MKTRILLSISLVSAGIFFISITSLIADPPDSSLVNNVRRKISQCFKLPADGFLTADYFQAEVTFFITRKGRIKVRKVSCDNLEVKRYIKQEMQCICCRKITAGLDKTYKLALNYKPEVTTAQGSVFLNSVYLASKSSP